MLNSRMWPVATTLHGAYIVHFHHAEGATGSSLSRKIKPREEKKKKREREKYQLPEKQTLVQETKDNHNIWVSAVNSILLSIIM